MFTQPFIQTHIKENIKAPRHWPLCGEFTGTGEFPAQRASYAENVSIWWRHHVYYECLLDAHSLFKLEKYVSLDVIIFMVVWELTPKFQSSASTICQNVHWYTKADGKGNRSVFDMNGVAVMACLLWLVIRNRWTMKRHLFAHRCDYGVDTVFECMLRKGSTADFRFFNIYHS